MRVVFSNRAYAAVMAETVEKIQTETGGLFLGAVERDTWYIIEAIDPGPKAVFEVAYFEYDQQYAQHLINKIANLYNEKLSLIGLWHRHPGSMDVFSNTDNGTNAKYADMRQHGAISALVNIDPTFRLTMYHVGRPCKYTKISYVVGDELIPDKYMILKTPQQFENIMNDVLHPQNVIGEYHPTVSLKSFMDLIEPYFKNRATNERADQHSASNEDIRNKIIDSLVADISFMSDEMRIEMSVLQNDGLFENLYHMSKDGNKMTDGDTVPEIQKGKGTWRSRMENFFGDEIKKTVFISEEQLTDTNIRELYGKYYADTSIYNIYPEAISDRGDFLCKVISGSEPIAESGFCSVQSEAGLKFYYDREELRVESYRLYQSIFSRNKGILETDTMSKKRAVILGCGSVGSLVSMELARAGVGYFLLADPDIVEYHNVCRHQCGIEDVGDLKVNALERKLKNINPNIRIEKFEGIVQNLPKDMFDKFCVEGDTVFVGCADNRAADVYTNRISIYYSAYFISIGFWERAYAGEIFYHIPNKGQPCYECALGEGSNISARAQANHHIYSGQENTEGVKFEPGISVDINFITTIGIKLIIDLLNLRNEGYIPRVLNDLKQFTVVCNTSNPEIGGEMVEIFSYPLQVTTSLVVDFRKCQCKERCTCKYELEEK